MKKAFSILFALMIALSTATAAFADKPVGFDSQGNEIAWANTSCAKIQSGTILDSQGNVVETGFTEAGYNYQAHEFNGTYDSSDGVIDGTYYGTVASWVSDKLIMSWSDEWIANVDCNGDHRLDRGLVNGVVYGDSRGWLTNHVVGDNYTIFTKIGYTGPGSPLWGTFTVLQDVYNDPTNGYHGVVLYADPGLGHYSH